MPSALDTQHAFDTPEGGHLALTPAGPIPRLLAWCIDTALRAAVMLAAAAPLGQMGGVGHGLLLLGAFGMFWLYPVFFEVRSGATPGKRALGLKVVGEDGSPISLGASMTRNLLRTADIFPMAYVVGLVCMMSSSRFQRLGDLAAGSLVIHAPLATGASPMIGDQVEPRPLLVALGPEEQRAVVAFAGRSADWSAQRRVELAAHIGDRASAGTPTQKVSALFGAARWYRGDR